MRMKILALLVTVGLGVAGAANRTSAADVWFSFPPKTDFMDLFRKPDQWPASLQGIDAFMLQSSFVYGSSDKQLAEIVGFLRKHGVKLALEAQMMRLGPNRCGQGIEGYKPPGYMRTVFQKLKAAGADLDFVAMDEPLWFGRLAKRKSRFGGSCQFSLLELAQNLRQSVSELLELYPRAEIGDEETIRSPAIDRDMPSGYLFEIEKWLAAFEQETGSKIRFLHWDVAWFPAKNSEMDKLNSNYWTATLESAVTMGRTHEIRTGIFYDGDPGDVASAAWNAHAIARYQAMEDELHIMTDTAVFATWMHCPERALPESDPATLSYLARSYIRDRDGRIR